MRCHVQGERRRAHARLAADHCELACAQPAGQQPVELGEAGGYNHCRAVHVAKEVADEAFERMVRRQAPRDTWRTHDCNVELGYDTGLDSNTTRSPCRA